jgi:16S rRNA (cytosine1402-N4)-methyltransferase
MSLNAIMPTELIAPHCSVLLDEVAEYLSIKDGGRYLDCTFGAGGYTRAILSSKDCYVTALDQDPTVMSFANDVMQDYGDRFNFIQTNFSDVAARLNGAKFDGIVLDLGISSMQVDQAARGFSFMQDGPLDMRMSTTGISAKEFLETASEQEIADIIYKYGEEVQSRAIAKNIVYYRQTNPIDTTVKLAEIVRDAKHYRPEKIDSATKTFQAIRIYINDELGALEQFLANVEDLLLPGGRLVVVSFHSLEDSIVKNFFKESSIKKVAKSKYSKEPDSFPQGKWLKIITKKPVVPSAGEVKRNPRSRSAKLRVAEKIRGDNVA